MGWLTAWDAVGGYFWNSVKIVIPAVLISTALGAINGYVLSMWRFRGSQLFFGLLLFGCFLPFQVILLPASFTLGKLGLANTTTGLVLVHVVYGLAFTTVPQLLRQRAGSAGAGGAAGWRRFLHHLRAHSAADVGTDHHGLPDLAVHPDLERLPLRRGVRQRRYQPVTVALNNLVNTSTGAKQYNVDMAAAMIAGLPTLVVYVIAGKYFLRGLTAGAVRVEENNDGFLELRNVQKSYGNSQIATLKDIALKIDAGEFLILVGPPAAVNPP